MRRKHEFGHGDLVSITEKEKATLLPNFLLRNCSRDLFVRVK